MNTPEPEPEIPAASIQRRIEATVFETVHPVSLWLACLFAFYGAMHLVVLPRDVAPILSALAFGTAASLLAMRAGIGVRRPALPSAHWIAGAIAGVALANALAHLFLLPSPSNSVNIVIFIMAVGGLMLSIRWVVLMISLALAGWGLVVVNAEPSPQWMHYWFALVGATLVSLVVAVMRKRNLIRLHTLDLQGQNQETKLAAALKETERSRAVLRTVSEVQADLLASAAPGARFARLLDTVIEATSSRYGLIALFPLDGERTGDGLDLTDIEVHAVCSRDWESEQRARSVDSGPWRIRTPELPRLLEHLVARQAPLVAETPDELGRWFGQLNVDTPGPGALLIDAFPHGRSPSGLLVLAGRDDGYRGSFDLDPLLAACAALAEAYRSEGRRQAAERDLRHHEALARAVVDASLDCIVTMDEAGRITEFNPAAERTFGYRREDVLGESLANLLIPSRARDAHRRGFARYMETGESSIIGRRLELDALRSDGSEFPVEIFVGVIDDLPERQFTAYLRDITEQRRAADDLREARDSAESANTAKSRFLATMSHEIRTPLNAIIGMSELLIGTKLSSDQREYANALHVSSASLFELINDVLDFSKIDADQMELDYAPFDPGAVLEEVAHLLSVRARERDLELVTFVDPNLPTLVTGDRQRLRQVLTNLIGNAIKFTPEGTVYAGVERVDSGDGKTVGVRYDVADTGIGISDEQQRRIFDRFVQVDDSTERRFEGTGLGLAIARSIVELMGGEISIDSRLGKGSAFTVRLRLPKAEEGASRVAVRGPQAHGGVLVVDDNARSREALRRTLEGYGYDVETAGGGYEALERLAGTPDRFAVLLIDERMPEMDGLATARIMVRQDGVPEVPAVLLWNSARPLDDSDHPGVVATVNKPIRQHELFATLDTVLGTAAPDGDDDVAGEPEPAATGTPLRILLVEDNHFNTLLATKLLESQGHVVDSASDGLMAIQYAEAGRYDLVLMDIEMPSMDGFDSTREIRKREAEIHRSPVPIVALTAHAVRGFRERCLDAGMNDYVSKPINDPKKLGEILDRWLDTRPSAYLVCSDPALRARVEDAAGNLNRCRLRWSSRLLDAVDWARDHWVPVFLYAPGTDADEAEATVRALADRARESAASLVVIVSDGIDDDCKVRLGELADACMPVDAVDRDLVDWIREQARARGIDASRDRRTHEAAENADAGADAVVTVDEGIAELVPDYLEEVRREVGQLTGLLHADQLEDIRRIGHQLKGSGAGYGFARITELGAALEEAARTENRERIGTVAGEFTNYLTTVTYVSA